MKEMKVRLTFVEKILGTSSADPELHSTFIASKAPDAPSREEEIEALGADEVERKEMTVFPRLDDGTPFIWDYQVRGFFKHACGMLRIVPDTKSSKIKAYKKYVDGLVFVAERKIPLRFDGEMGNIQRPLRASTLQGERIALANSETCPAGTVCEFIILILKDDLDKTVEEWLNYGRRNGMLQWRNAGYGSFTWEKLEDWKEVDF